MSRRDLDRLADIVDAIDAIAAHMARGRLDDGLVYDAVRARLIEIGEAVKSVHPDVLGRVPMIPWADIARMRDQLAHRYFDTTHGIVADTVRNDLQPLRAAVLSLVAQLDAPM
jgi:uncharacterized protein with HEPN domain